MNISPGKILISTPALEDPHFDKAVIFLAEYNQNGALGFVINKLFPRVFNELSEFSMSKEFALYAGGPVKNEELFFIHRRPDLIADGIHISDSIYLGGNFQQAVKYMDDNTLSEKDIKLFIGYCGWDYAELEEEVNEGSWLVSDSTSATIFAPHNEKLWEELYQQSL